MRAHEFLVEYNREKTKQMFGKQIERRIARENEIEVFLSDKEPNAVSEQDVVNTLARIENLDPTPNKAYVAWLVREYINGWIIDLDDASIRVMMAKYDKFKKSAQFPADRKNISALSMPALKDFMRTYEPPIDVKKDVKAKTVWDSDTFRAIIPENEITACYYGRGTKWCTSAKENNMFDAYNEKGELYILLPKQPKYTGEKYQVHFGVGQFMNELNEPASEEFLRERFPDYQNFCDSLVETLYDGTAIRVIGSVMMPMALAVIDKKTGMRYTTAIGGFTSDDSGYLISFGTFLKRYPELQTINDWRPNYMTSVYAVSVDEIGHIWDEMMRLVAESAKEEGANETEVAQMTSQLNKAPKSKVLELMGKYVKASKIISFERIMPVIFRHLLGKDASEFADAVVQRFRFYENNGWKVKLDPVSSFGF